MGMKEFIAEQKRKAREAEEAAKNAPPPKEKFYAEPGHIADPDGDEVDEFPNLPFFPADLYSDGALDDAAVESEGRLLGEGAFGKVVSATLKATGAVVAIKKMRWQGPKMEKNVRREFGLNAAVEHKGIVRALGLYCDERSLILVQEQCAGGHLGVSSDKGPPEGLVVEVLAGGEAAARAVVGQVVDALVALHSKNIAHLDLKFENIMKYEADGEVSAATFKLIDFGLSRELTNKAKGMFGTPFLCPPQMFAKEEFGLEADMWQLGCVMHKLLVGTMPFFHENRVELAALVEKAEVDFEADAWQTVSDDAKDLLAKMLTASPDDRITSTDACSHPWFK